MDDLDPKQRITLRLDCHTVALTVPRSQEPVYRNAAEVINRTYQRYTRLYPQASVEMIWVYVALEVAVNLQSDTRDKNLQPILQTLSSFNEQIKQTLKQNTTNNTTNTK